MTDRTSSSITVAADRATVMRIIADFGAYPDWATGVRAAEVVETSPGGGPRRVRFSLDAGVIRDTYVLAYDWDVDTALRGLKTRAESGSSTGRR